MRDLVAPEQLIREIYQLYENHGWLTELRGEYGDIGEAFLRTGEKVEVVWTGESGKAAWQTTQPPIRSVRPWFIREVKSGYLTQRKRVII